MKNYLREILKQIRFYRSRVYRRLRKTKGQRRILLLNTPLHGNLGDAAIVLAERKFLTERTSLPWVEITQQDLLYFHKLILKRIQPEDILALQGGGSIGTLWPLEQEVITEILSTFSQHKIIIFPQTMYFSPDETGEQVKNAFVQTVCRCGDLTIFLRDARSYALAQELLGQTGAKLHLTPDIVTYFDGKAPAEKENRILLCFRRDLEGVLNSEAREKIREFALSLGAEVLVTDTQIDGELTVASRSSYVEAKLQEFSKARLIITDRIHGMVFAAIAGTACIAVDNISKKVSGAHQWISCLDYVKMATDTVTPEDMQVFYEKTENAYSNAHLQDYYGQIAQAFEL